MYKRRKETELNLDLIKERLILWEGLVLHLYKCSSNYNTIGAGRNLDAKGISHDEAMHLLDNDIKEAICALDDNYPSWNTHALKVQYVLIDMCFNMGWGTLSTFRKFLKALEERRYADAAVEIENSRYCEQVGRRALFNAEEIRSLQE